MNANEIIIKIDEKKSYIKALESACLSIEPALEHDDTSDNKMRLLEAQKIIRSIIEYNQDKLERIKLKRTLDFVEF